MKWENLKNRPWHEGIGQFAYVGDGDSTQSFTWNGKALDALHNDGLPYSFQQKVAMPL